MNHLKRKVKIYNSIKKNKTLRNKYNQGGERFVQYETLMKEIKDNKSVERHLLINIKSIKDIVNTSVLSKAI